MKTPITFFLIDKNEITRAGFRTLLNEHESLFCVGEAAGLSDVCASQTPAPDVVVVAYDSSPELRQALSELRHKWCTSRVLLVLDDEETRNASVRSLSSSVDGYCRKHAPLALLNIAIQAVARGGFFLDPECSGVLLASKECQPTCGSAGPPEDCPFGLSSREYDVLDLLTKARTNPEIARILGISPETVKSHVKHILEKMSAADRTEAVRNAIRAGLYARS
jgi:DNA-binding NarL/FixJ family response regulator